MKKNPNPNNTWWKIAVPVLIGLGVVGWMFWSEASEEVFSNFAFDFTTALFILLAFAFMAGRDLGYIIRIRLFARGDLSWRQAFRVIMLWEFTSAITPSTIGGTSVAVVFVHKEGLSVGKSATMVMLTAFFDELFFAICFPLVIFLVGFGRLFAFEGATGLMWVIMAGYAIKLLLTMVLAYGLFINPRGLRWVIIKLFSLPLLRRWKEGARRSGNDIVVSSRQIKHYRWDFWFKAFGATALSWCSRFMVANALFLAFFSVSDHLLVFARQLCMWVPMIISPTPGGSGFAEYIFQNFLGDVIAVSPETMAGTVAMIALLWRGVTYYPYLFIGALIIPTWLSTSFRKTKSPTPIIPPQRG
ncbi:MAG: lysylphosphatidylglycerol synthase transmembrane domain-containing protein [Mucinivorans sp.]